MGQGWRFACAAVSAGVLLFFTGGCSTVVFQDAADAERAAPVERTALLEAALKVSRTKWPRPDDASLGRLLVSSVTGSGDRITESEAVDAYLERLGGADRAFAIVTDAENHIAAANALAGAALAAADAVRPTKSDVMIVEGAIGDLRSVRDVYRASLKRVARDGEKVDPDTVQDLKSAFNDAIEEMGDAADALADAVAHDRTETLAGSRPRPRANFTAPL